MSIRDAQNRLSRIARAIGAGKGLRPTDRTFLTDALNLIAAGEDANSALNVRAGKGERKGLAARKKDFNRRLAMGWIAAARLPLEEGGLGLTLEQAVGMIGENNRKNFGLTEETLRTYWNKNPELRQVEFVIPEEDREED